MQATRRGLLTERLLHGRLKEAVKRRLARLVNAQILLQPRVSLQAELGATALELLLKKLVEQAEKGLHCVHRDQAHRSVQNQKSQLSFCWSA